MSKDWIDKLRTKLEDHASTPPEGLWESLSAELGIAQEQQPTRDAKLIQWLGWRRIAVAAVAVLVIGVGLVPMLWQDVSTPDVPMLVTAQDIPPFVGNPLGVEESVAPPLRATEPLGYPSEGHLLALAQETTRGDRPQPKEEISSVYIETVPASETTTSPAEAPSHVDSGSTEVEERHIIIVPQAQAEVPQELSLQDLGQVQHYRDGSRWSASMHMRGQLPAPRNNSGGGGLPTLSRLSAMDSELRLFSSREAIPEPTRVLSFTDDPQYTFRHRAPLRMGLSVSYELDQHLSLQTGIVYSYLRSDYSVNHSYLSISGQQELHYIGVPFGVSYRLIDLGRLSLYSSVGTMVEKCLYGYMRSRSEVHADVRRPDYAPEERNFQWSAKAGLGLEYRVSQGLSFFVEPQMSYYFDNGSLIRSYYKEHPLSFDFQLGFRWNLRTRPL